MTNTPVYLDLTADNIEAQSKLVSESDNYGKEGDIIRSVLLSFPKNDDLNTVAMKIALIDVTNSTQLSRHKSKISLYDLAKTILEIENIDNRIACGDTEVVNIIAKNKGSIILFSLASKYCTYHNRHVYNRDDYSIYDSVVREYLPHYANEIITTATIGKITTGKIDKWRRNINYAEFNKCIDKVLNEHGIHEDYPERRRKFDHFLWYPNKDNNKMNT